MGTNFLGKGIDTSFTSQVSPPLALCQLILSQGPNLPLLIRRYFHSFQSLPDKNLNDLSQVCRTFSLATLKNIFPPSSHFTKGGNTSNISPSGYVAEYIGKKTTLKSKISEMANSSKEKSIQNDKVSQRGTVHRAPNCKAF